MVGFDYQATEAVIHQPCLDPALRDSQISVLSGPFRDVSNYDPGIAGNLQDDVHSDADSAVEMEFEQSMDRFRDSVMDFQTPQRFASSQEILDRQPRLYPRTHRVGLKGNKGPRKAVEPTGDIKLRMGQANEAFIQERYEDARVIVSEVIRINAETYEAWTLLALIFEELGDMDKALMALMFAAHMRPKNVQAWINCAEFAVNNMRHRREQYLPSALFCYASALRADPDCIQARYGKAEIHMERGKLGSAVAEYSYIVRENPGDTKTVRILAELLVDLGNVEQAKDLYRNCIEYLKSVASVRDFSWTHVSAYAALYEASEDYAMGIQVLKSVARWLATGQGDDLFSDRLSDDDREWDVDSHDQTRSDLRGNSAGSSSHGLRLPLDIRVQLGLYRLRLGHYAEAIRHFASLKAEAALPDPDRVSHPDLLRRVADELRMAECFRDALTFYEPLINLPGVSTAAMRIDVGSCYLKEGLFPQAEESFQTALQLDEFSIDARRKLAQMYEDLDEHEEALSYLNEIRSIRFAQQGKGSARGMQAPRHADRGQTALTGGTPQRLRYIPRRVGDNRIREKQEAVRMKQLQDLLTTMRLHQEGMRAGKSKSTHVWLDAAKEVTDDFRSCTIFYPWETRSKRQREVDETVEPNAATSDLDADLNDMRERLSRRLETRIKAPLKELPTNHRGIHYDEWLDIFLEYAVRLSVDGRAQEAYDVCQSAFEARPFEQDPARKYMVTVCMYTLALLANDDRSCAKIARIFMNEPDQFGADSYRMFAAVARMCQSPTIWYSSGPTQKYMLRQIKNMDDNIRAKFEDECGEHLTIPLLMLYGHILYTGTSYSYALNYFFRAYALDPKNSTINLNLGVTYLHYALKRQAGNRQYLILQGFTFLHQYYEQRRISDVAEQREEAYFNIARAYHLVGLAHLAMPYYLQALNERRSEDDSAGNDSRTVKVTYIL